MLVPSFVARPVGSLQESGSAFNRFALLLCADVGVLKGLTWRRVAYTFLVAAGLALSSAAGNWLRVGYGWNPKSIGISHLFLDQDWGFFSDLRVLLLLFIPQMLALTVADNLRISRVPRTVLLTVGLAVGATVGSVVIMTSGHYFSRPPATGLLVGGLIAFVYFKRRRDEELGVALHAAQLTRVDLQKQVLESQLQFMQAHVEPQFLFNTLRRVAVLYETDRLSADTMLDHLIAYLRAALPQMRTSTSTLGQEVQLARAYLGIERIRAHGRLDFSFHVPDRLTSAGLPPMVLLPLIEAFALRDRNAALDGEVVCTDARVDAGMLTLTVAVQHPHALQHATGEIECIRNRLTALYSADGKLRVESRSPFGAIATVELPYVPT